MMEKIIELTDKQQGAIEDLDLLSAIKHVHAETKSWENVPTNSEYQLRKAGFISQPLISDLGAFRVGFFKREFTALTAHNVNSPSLFMAIIRRETQEGVAIRLYPARVSYLRNTRHFPCLTFFYRSRKNNARIFSINLELNEIRSYFEVHRYHYLDDYLPELVNAVSACEPNFEMKDSGIDYSYKSHNRLGDAVVYVDKLESIEIELPWDMEFSSMKGISLNYRHILPNVWYKDPFVVELKFSNEGISPNQSFHQQLQLTATWPKFYLGTRLLKFLARLDRAYKNCLSFDSMDFIAETDEPISESDINVKDGVKWITEMSTWWKKSGFERSISVKHRVQ